MQNVIVGSISEQLINSQHQKSFPELFSLSIDPHWNLFEMGLKLWREKPKHDWVLVRVP